MLTALEISRKKLQLGDPDLMCLWCGEEDCCGCDEWAVAMFGDEKELAEMKKEVGLK